MSVAINADVYASTRLNIFFPGITPDLNGQCVSLEKWFTQDMSKVPNPQAARGDARYVGDTLVAQGHAVEVPYEDRKRGDIICYKFSEYGHIGVQLSGGRIFEQNVNMGGVQSQVITQGKDSWTVYASRIGSENESWRKNPHVYRLKTYVEGDVMTEDGVRYIYKAVTGQEPGKSYTEKDVKYWIGRSSTEFGASMYKFSDNFIVAANAEIKQLSAGLTILAPGKYQVK